MILYVIMLVESAWTVECQIQRALNCGSRLYQGGLFHSRAVMTLRKFGNEPTWCLQAAKGLRWRETLV
jgi:hypothetical protein